MTRDELGNVLSANMPTRTIHNDMRAQAEGKEIDGTWNVVYLETDAHGTLVIYCEEPNK
jgi:hypothetical protein